MNQQSRRWRVALEEGGVPLPVRVPSRRLALAAAAAAASLLLAFACGAYAGSSCSECRVSALPAVAVALHTAVRLGEAAAIPPSPSAPALVPQAVPLATLPAPLTEPPLRSAAAALPPVGSTNASALACVRGACALANVCFATDTGRWTLYTGAAACLAGDGPTAGPVCAGGSVVVYGTMDNGEAMSALRLSVVGEPPPPGVRWFGDDTAVVVVPELFLGDNWWHVVQDLALPLFWQLRWLLGHADYVGDGSGGSSGQGPASPAAPRVLYVPRTAEQYSRFQAFLAAAFPRLELVLPADLAAAAGGHAEGSRELCFRRAVVGSFYVNLGRAANGRFRAAGGAPQAASTRQEVYAEVRAFRRHLLQRMGLPPPPQPLQPQPKPRTLVIAHRLATRKIEGIDELAAAVRAVAASAAEPWTVVVAVFEELTLADTAALMSRADVLLGVHGAGLTNMLFMPAGGTVVEIAPCGTPTQLQFMPLARALGLVHQTLSVCSSGGWNDPIRLDLAHVEVFLATLLPAEW